MAQPKYLQVIEKIQQEYADKDAHTPIASERELAASLGFSRMTVRKAVEELCRQGFLYRDGNKGTFLSGKTPAQAGLPGAERKRILFMDSLYDSNNVKTVQQALRLHETDRLFRLVRLVLSQDVPLRVEEIYAAADNISDEELGQLDSFLDLDAFRRKGNSTNKLAPMLVPAKYARLLQLRADQPVLCREECISADGWQPFLFVSTIYNPQTSPLVWEE